MTTYSYTLTVDDSECIALEAALKLMIEHCEAQLKDGPCSPYGAHKQSCIKMLERLFDNARMTSTSSSCWPSGESTGSVIALPLGKDFDWPSGGEGQ
jgi:hypothetical protein